MLKSLLLGTGLVIATLGIVFYALSGTKPSLNDNKARPTNTPVIDEIKAKPAEPESNPEEPSVEKMYTTYKECVESTATVQPEDLNAMEKALPNVKFKLAENKKIKWLLTMDPVLQETEVTAASSRTAILPHNDLSISEYLKSIGYHDDFVNTGSATVKGFVSYYNGCNVCRLEMELVDANAENLDLTGDYKITVSCGNLKKLDNK